MIPCITIGDSIAVGVGQTRPECEIIARVGITSARYVATLLPPGRTTAATAVISLGVNDGDTADTIENLRIVRARIDAAAVVWLLPGLKPDVRDMIRTVAEENGDRTLDTRPEVGRDHLHPTGAGYERLAAAAIGQNGAGVEVADAPDEPRSTRIQRRTHAFHHTNRHADARHAHARLNASLPHAPSLHAPSLHARTFNHHGTTTPASTKLACTKRCRPRALRG